MNSYMRKRASSGGKNLKYDFMPSMIEIIEKPANPLGSIILYVIITLILVTVIWACNKKIDIAVTAEGSIETKEPLVILNSVIDGRISSINIKDGQYVNKGDVICTFESGVNKITLKEYKYNYDVLTIQKEIYQKLYDKYQNNDYSQLDTDVSKYGDLSRYAEAIIIENNMMLESLEGLDEESREKVSDSRLLTIIQNINNTESSIQTVSGKIEECNKSLEDKKIIATESGKFVDKCGLYTGKTVSYGENIGYIVNDTDEYIFKAYVSNQDIADISINESVKIKLSAFNNTRYEYMEGEITEIEDVPVNMENKGIYYVVNIKLNDNPDNLKLGLSGSIDIIVGQRTVMDYFIEPFRKGLKNSIKEK